MLALILSYGPNPEVVSIFGEPAYNGTSISAEMLKGTSRDIYRRILRDSQNHTQPSLFEPDYCRIKEIKKILRNETIIEVTD